MQTLRLAAIATLVLGALSAPTSASLVLVAGPNEGTFATNNYGYAGTYYDQQGPGGNYQYVAHPNGGPVAFLYVFSNGGGISTYFDATAGPYDSPAILGGDDTQVAVLNLSNKPILSLSLKSTSDIFGFDGDGIDTYGAPSNSSDVIAGVPTGYGGPQTYFTGITGGDTTGTANFVGGLAANGGTTYFSLEVAPTIGTMPSPVPEPSSIMMAGCGLAIALGYVRRRRAIAGRSE